MEALVQTGRELGLGASIQKAPSKRQPGLRDSQLLRESDHPRLQVPSRIDRYRHTGGIAGRIRRQVDHRRCDFRLFGGPRRGMRP